MYEYPVSFILKKVISDFIAPLPFSMGIIILGLIFLWFTKKQKTGKILATVGLGILVFFSSETGSNLLIKPLEDMYPPYQSNNEKEAKYIVILDGGGIFHTNVPYGCMLKPFGAMGRLFEGISIYKENPGSKMILTGTLYGNINISEADIFSSIAVHYGVNKNDIITVTNILDTSDEAKNVAKIVNNEPFILVTSAAHLPRSMMLFKKQGTNPIPAPSAYMQKGIDTGIKSLPTGLNLFKSEQALHEYIGITWGKINGTI